MHEGPTTVRRRRDHADPPVVVAVVEREREDQETLESRLKKPPYSRLVGKKDYFPGATAAEFYDFIRQRVSTLTDLDIREPMADCPPKRLTVWQCFFGPPWPNCGEIGEVRMSNRFVAPGECGSQRW